MLIHKSRNVKPSVCPVLHNHVQRWYLRQADVLLKQAPYQDQGYGAMQSITEYLAAIESNRTHYVGIKEQVERLCKEELERVGVKALIQSRVKSLKSLEKKLHDRFPKYPIEADNVAGIKDLVGLQLIYRSYSEKERIELFIRENFNVQSESQHPKVDRQASESRFRGYDAHHFYVRQKSATDETHKDPIIEIQVVFVATWVWATWDHDIVYKVLSGPQPKSVLVALQFLLGLGNLSAVAVELMETLLVSDPGSPLHQDAKRDANISPNMASAIRDFLLEHREDFHSASAAQPDHPISKTDRAERGEYMRWISQNDFDNDQYEILQKRWPHTGEWLIKHQEFQTWFLNPRSKVIGCKATPGSGKSVLASVVINHIMKDEHTQDADVGLAFAYFRYASKVTQTPVYIVNALIKQLCRRMDKIPEELLDSWHSHSRNDLKLNFEESASLLTIAIQSLKQVFLVFDALDECEEESRTSILNLIWDLTMKFPCVKVFVTSRPEAGVNSFFIEFQVSVIRIDAKEDIRRYVDGYLDELLQPRQQQSRPRIRTLNIQNPEMRQEIFEALVQNADGLFLWVKLQFNILCRLQDETDIRNQLRSLPKGLDETYQRIMVQIEEEPERVRDLALKCLTWVLNARRELTSAEFNEAVVANENHSTEQNSGNEQRQYTTEYLIDCCKNLLTTSSPNLSGMNQEGVVFVRGDSERHQMRRRSQGELDSWAIIRPIHHTVKQYFDRKSASALHGERYLSQDAQVIEAEMAATCLACLGSPEGLPSFSRGVSVRMAKNWKPFLFYCAGYFDMHLKACPEMSPNLRAQNLRFAIVLRSMNKADLGAPALWKLRYVGQTNSYPSRYARWQFMKNYWHLFMHRTIAENEVHDEIITSRLYDVVNKEWSKRFLIISTLLWEYLGRVLSGTCELSNCSSKLAQRFARLIDLKEDPDSIISELKGIEGLRESIEEVLEEDSETRTQSRTQSRNSEGEGEQEKEDNFSIPGAWVNQ